MVGFVRRQARPPRRCLEARLPGAIAGGSRGLTDPAERLLGHLGASPLLITICGRFGGCRWVAVGSVKLDCRRWCGENAGVRFGQL